MPIAFPPPSQGNIFNDFPLRYRKPFAVVPVPKAVNRDRQFFQTRAPTATALVNPVTSSIGSTRLTDRRVYDRVLGYPVAAPQLVTPSTASLVTVLFAPSVLTPRLVTPTTASLTITRFAPSVLTPRLVIPGTLTLVTTRFAPTVLTPRLVTPAVASLVTVLFAPTVTAGGVGPTRVTKGRSAYKHRFRDSLRDYLPEG